jgi:hypothetical protein
MEVNIQIHKWGIFPNLKIWHLIIYSGFMIYRYFPPPSPKTSTHCPLLSLLLPLPPSLLLTTGSTRTNGRPNNFPKIEYRSCFYSEECLLLFFPLLS